MAGATAGLRWLGRRQQPRLRLLLRGGGGPRAEPPPQRSRAAGAAGDFAACRGYIASAGLGHGNSAGLPNPPPPAAAPAAALAAAAAAAAAAALLAGDGRGSSPPRGWPAPRRGAAAPSSSWSRCEVARLEEEPKYVLSADCGGTTTRLMLYSVLADEQIEEKKPAPGTLIREEKYPNIMFKSLQEIMELFISQDCGLKHGQIRVAVLALAGVVVNNHCRFTNLDWVVDGDKIGEVLGIGRVELINDFVAQGYGMLTLGDDEVTKLNDAVPRPSAPIACIGAGTGLGQCFLTPDGAGGYLCHPSEGAHGEFGPRGAGSDDIQIELLKYLKIRFSGWNRISVERVVSGRGICNIYEFLAYTKPHSVDARVHKLHLDKPFDASIIATNAWPDSLCERAMKIFGSCYGAQCGTMALNFQPFGGLYITGGVTKKVAPWLLRDGSFMAAYSDKGRVSPLLDQVPLYIVKSDDMGQRGAHLRSVRLLKEEIEKQARSLFDALDTEHRGVLSMQNLEESCVRLGDKDMAQYLMQEMDKNKDGVVAFQEFLESFSHLPDWFVKQSKLVKEHCPQQESEVHLSASDLVAPPDRGNDAESRAELAEVLQHYKLSRNRRQTVDESEDRNQPVFKAMVWKLKPHGSRRVESDWQPREYWINKRGAVIYYSATQRQTLLYLTRADLSTATIEEVDDPTSVRPWIFRIHPHTTDGAELGPTDFAAPSQEGRAYWVQQLRELQRPAPPVEP